MPRTCIKTAGRSCFTTIHFKTTNAALTKKEFAFAKFCSAFANS